MQPENNSQLPNNDSQPTGQYPPAQPTQSADSTWQGVSSSTSAPAAPVAAAPLASTPQPLSQAATPPTPKSKKKKFAIIGGVVAAFLIVGSSAGAYFGFVAPNNPDTIWSKALSNTADGYDEFIKSSEAREEKKTVAVKGNFKYDSKELVADGNIDAKFDNKDAVVKVDAGAVGARFTLDVLATTPEGAKNPDIYARVTGLNGIDQVLGAEAGGVGSALAAYDNQWYLADHTLLDQLEKEAGQSTGGIPTFTKEEVRAVDDAIGRVNREYIFTTDESKAVLTKTQNVGKEKFDDRDAYHFKVGYKKDKLKAYAAALTTELKKTKLNMYLTDETNKELLASIDKLDDSQQADAWVDLDTKLIRNVRIVTDQSKGDTMDIGQKYNGGDEIPFIVSFTSKEKDNEGTASLIVTANLKSDDVKIKADLKASEKGSPYTVTFDGTLTATNEDVTIEKPAGAKSIMEMYGQLMNSFMMAQPPSPGTSTL